MDGSRRATEPTNATAERDRSLRAVGRRFGPVLGTLVVVGALLLAARGVDGDALLATVASADPRLLAVGAIVYTLSWPLRGRRYGVELEATGHRAGTTLSTAAVFVSQSANLVIPARAGDAARAYVVHERVGVPYTAGVAALAVERGFDLAAISGIAAAAAGWLVASGAVEPTALVATSETGRTALLVAAAVGTATVAAGLVVATVAWTNRAGRLRNRIPDHVAASSHLSAAIDGLYRFGADVERVVRRPRTLVVVGGTSVLIWSLDVLTAVVVLGSLDGGLSAWSALSVGALAVSVGNLAKVLPLSQGGIGLYEAGFAALVVGLTPLGVGAALAAAVLDHALKNAVTLLGGAVSSLSLGLSIADVSGADGDRQAF